MTPTAAQAGRLAGSHEPPQQQAGNSTLRKRGPYPVIALSGEQGSAKSTFAAILRALLDPNTADGEKEAKLGKTGSARSGQ